MRKKRTAAQCLDDTEINNTSDRFYIDKEKVHIESYTEQKYYYVLDNMRPPA